MNKYLRQLQEMAESPSRRIIGLMSGTSLDGLDIALCRIRGWGPQTQLDIERFKTCPYDAKTKTAIKQVFARQNVDLQELAILNEEIGILHAAMINDCLKDWEIHHRTIDCIASHGQTVMHAPRRVHQQPNRPNASLQLGDADHIAWHTGVITIADFRQKHLAAGFEGAPLALFGDQILFSSDKEARVLLNIGGISNISFLPAKDKASGLVSTDCGPGNTICDALARRYFDLPYDANGALAASGRLHEGLLSALLSHPFLQDNLPKTTGPEVFNLDFFDHALSEADAIGTEPRDLLHTAGVYTAACIASCIKQTKAEENTCIYVSGGGVHNSFLLGQITKLTSMRLQPLDVLGVDPDAKEAALFALLANETICGSGQDAGASASVCLGKISFPA